MLQLDPHEYAKLKLCFSPESAAIIGASADPRKFGGRALKFCLEREYGGRLYPVNAKNRVVQGVKAYRHVSELPEAPDIAVIAVPAPFVRDSLEAAGEKGAQIAIVYGAQFAEAGEAGKEKQDELLGIARRSGMRMIGPNCMGVISLSTGFVASFTSAPEHHGGEGWPDPGTISVASQSGAVGIQMFAQLRDRGLGLANWISTGNQADIDVADAIAYFAGDPETRTIAVYLEDAGRGLKLTQALEIARQARKPVVALKVGTTPLGGKAARGHTASMYAEDRLVGDVFDQFGVIRADSITELIDLVSACDAGVIPSSGRVAAISVSGGGAVMISDAASKHGLELPEYPADALDDLKKTNPFVNDRNPIDISAPSMSDMSITGGHLKWGLERGEPSMIGYISHVPMVPRTRREIIPQLLGFRSDHSDQLIAIAANMLPGDRKQLVASGVAVFEDPIAATVAVAQLVNAGKAHDKPARVPSGPEEPVADLRERLAGLGLPLAEERAVRSPDDALAALSEFGAISLKLNGAGLDHKTEIDGVRTGLTDPDAARKAFEHLQGVAANVGPEQPHLGIIAQPHLEGVEFLVGVRRDPSFGPLVVLGTGGPLSELFNDMAYAKAPFGEAEAESTIGKVKAGRMLSGWRGTVPVDGRSLVRSLVALSNAAPSLPSFEINPAFVTRNGVVGADLLVVD